VRLFLCLALAAASSTCAVSQTIPIPFLEQLKAQLLLSGLRQSITINGSADWVAGSTRDSGPVTLNAKADGSSEVLLAFANSRHAETSSSFARRSCQWLDKNGVSHEVKGVSCLTPLPWFSPATLPLLLSTPAVTVRDGGQLSEGNLLRHQLIVDLSGTYIGQHAQAFAAATQVKISYDPATLTPTRLEYNLHPDNDNTLSIPVRVVFSDYRTFSGIPVPFHMERYIDGALELRVAVDSVVLN